MTWFDSELGGSGTRRRMNLVGEDLLGALELGEREAGVVVGVDHAEEGVGGLGEGLVVLFHGECHRCGRYRRPGTPFWTADLAASPTAALSS